MGLPVTAQAWYSPLLYTHAPVRPWMACVVARGKRDWDRFERNQVIEPAPRKEESQYIARKNTEDQSQLRTPQLGLENKRKGESCSWGQFQGGKESRVQGDKPLYSLCRKKSKDEGGRTDG